MFMCKSRAVKVSAVIITYPWKRRKCVGCPPSFFWQPHCLYILGPGMCLSLLPASSYSDCCCTVRLISSLSAYLPHCWTLRLVQHRKLGAMRHVWDMFGCQNPAILWVWKKIGENIIYIYIAPKCFQICFFPLLFDNLILQNQGREKIRNL